MSRRILISCFCTVLLLGGCAQKNDILLLERKIYEQEQALNALKNDIGKTSEVVDDVRPDQADLWSELQTLKVQVAQMQGDLEDIQLKTDSFPDTEKDINTLKRSTFEVESGLRQMASELGMELEIYKNKPLPAAPVPQTPPASTTVSQTAPTPASPAVPAPQPEPVAVQPPQAAKTPAAVAGSTSQRPESNISEPSSTQKPVVKPAKQKESPEPKLDTAQALYDAAYEAFSKRRYNDALTMWEEFSTTFPKHTLTPNAVFWQGEALYQAQDYARAALRYQRVLKEYKKSSKYRAAMLKQGLALIHIGKTKAGKIRLNEVVKKYPKSAEAKRAKVELNKIK